MRGSPSASGLRCTLASTRRLTVRSRGAGGRWFRGKRSRRTPAAHQTEGCALSPSPGCLAARTRGKRHQSLAPVRSRPAVAGIGGGTGRKARMWVQGFKLPGSRDSRETPSVSRTSAGADLSARTSITNKKQPVKDIKWHSQVGRGVPFNGSCSPYFSPQQGQALLGRCAYPDLALPWRSPPVACLVAWCCSPPDLNPSHPLYPSSFTPPP